MSWFARESIARRRLARQTILLASNAKNYDKKGGGEGVIVCNGDDEEDEDKDGGCGDNA